LSGFVSTALCSLVVSAVQGGGNTLLGMPCYAQQVMSALAALLALAAAGYAHVALVKRG